jgi:hypothetical protein
MGAVNLNVLFGTCNEELLAKYNYRVQVKEDEMGRACSTHGAEEECVEDFGWKSRRKETTRKT